MIWTSAAAVVTRLLIHFYKIINSDKNSSHWTPFASTSNMAIVVLTEDMRKMYGMYLQLPPMLRRIVYKTMQMLGILTEKNIKINREIYQTI